MSYQVLARKWRPRRFAELVGQEHVVRALSHALDSGRIHHAFLFTGTRGVGKTTIARIFAKSLNCERGVGADPCGECSSCRDIDAGRFVDLLEIDAASRTKVDDTREMLDNVIYAPARGRYKVYLIDEVHMLSGHSFNALLKTLEEPPPHVKFLLATTDPQKLPVTVLSRCLQFNLKRLSDEQIAAQVEKILGAEEIAHDAESVREIARGGNGSLRDALSLLDQAIAFGGGKLVASDVRAMLGTVDRSRVAGLLAAVVAGDAKALHTQIVEVAEFAPDFAAVLDEIAGTLHRAQLAQFVPDAVDARDEPLAAQIARDLPAEEIQLLYQLAIHGRRDLALAPGPRAGFEMTLLRMLAFRPVETRDAGGAPSGGGGAGGRRSSGTGSPDDSLRGGPSRDAGWSPRGGASAQATADAVATPEPPRMRLVDNGLAASAQAPAAAAASMRVEVVPDPTPSPRTTPAAADAARAVAAMTAPSPSRATPATVTTLRTTPSAPTAPRPAVDDKPAASAEPPGEGLLEGAQWRQALESAALRGPARELAINVVPLGWRNGRLRLGIAAQQEHLRTEASVQRLAEALAVQFGAGLRLDFEPVTQADGALAAQLRREGDARQQAAEASIAADPVVQGLIDRFDARVVPNATRPIARE